MRIILCDINKGMAEAWKKAFSSHKEVEVYNGSIFEFKVDAIVSPANSFGFMDGGIDWHISQFLGWHVQERLQNLIKDRPLRELLIGEAVVVKTDNTEIPHVISAPTMRIPQVLGGNSVNPYLATKAALSVAKQSNFESVSFSGMGTGVGQIPFSVCAEQMLTAYEEIILGRNVFPKNWYEAKIAHHSLLTV